MGKRWIPAVLYNKAMNNPGSLLTRILTATGLFVGGVETAGRVGVAAASLKDQGKEEVAKGIAEKYSPCGNLEVHETIENIQKRVASVRRRNMNINKMLQALQEHHEKPKGN